MSKPIAIEKKELKLIKVDNLILLWKTQSIQMNKQGKG